MATMLLFLGSMLNASVANSSVKVDFSGEKVPVSRSLFGIFFEEINHAGEGGLYSELLRNRGLAPGENGLPQGWTAVQGSASFDPAQRLNDARQGSIKLGAPDVRAVVANEGFWGIVTKRSETLTAKVWVKGSGNVSVRLVTESGAVLASSPVQRISSEWSLIEHTLSPGKSAKGTRFEVVAEPGAEAWIGYASLMPSETWKNRTNGLRSDLAERLVAMQPGFVRFPGGCYVEGNNLSNCFDWKSTLVPVEQRPATPRIFWGYNSSNGLGYHEYLQLCEDLKSEPMFVVNCGMSHSEIAPMDQMNKWVQDALDAIEYANGPVTSKFGAMRAKNGHPKPFGLKYVEIGNENGYNWSYGGPAPYYERFALIHNAIKAKYPEIITISNVPTPVAGDLTSEHYYESPDWFWKNKDRYDRYDRAGTKVYIGEYAVTRANGRGSLAGALGEAAFMTGMERNADMVSLASYAPLFENIKGRQWNPNAIVFDGSTSYGTPSYWVQKLFAKHRVDVSFRPDVSESMSAPPAVVGRFGFKTWRTKAEFKDIKIEVNGQTKLDRATLAVTNLTDARGDWSSSDGTLKQSNLGDDRMGLIKDVSVGANDNWTFEFTARATEGEEGFMPLFGMTNPREGLQWNLGGWQNSVHAFQRNGERVGAGVRAQITPNAWYRVKLEKTGGVVRGYLNSALVEELREQGAPDFAASVGIDYKSREVVLKLVSSSSQSRVVDLKGFPISASGSWSAEQLSHPDIKIENRLEDPEAVAPRKLQIPAKNWVEIPPHSLTIVRIPATKVILETAKVSTSKKKQ